MFCDSSFFLFVFLLYKWQSAFDCERLYSHFLKVFLNIIFYISLSLSLSFCLLFPNNFWQRSVTEQLPTIATILNRLAWLSNHVAIDAILDTKLQHWSFERALLSGLVEPPLFSPFSKTITAATIAELRDECRIEWARFDGIVSRAKLK